MTDKKPVTEGTKLASFYNRLGLHPLRKDLKNPEDAIPALRTALGHDNKNPVIHHNLGVCLLSLWLQGKGKSKDLKKGADHLRKAVELKPEDLTYNSTYGCMLSFVMKEHEVALPYLRKAVELADDSSKAKYQKDLELCEQQLAEIKASNTPKPGKG